MSHFFFAFFFLIIRWHLLLFLFLLLKVHGDGGGLVGRSALLVKKCYGVGGRVVEKKGFRRDARRLVRFYSDGFRAHVNQNRAFKAYKTATSAR